MYEILIPTIGFTALLMFVAWRYYWTGFNNGAKAFSEILHKYEPEAHKRIQSKIIINEET